MRFSLSSSLALVALGACSSHAASSTPSDAGDQGGDDGSTAGCTSVGGTCEPFSAGSCPVLQQNAQLCGNVLLVCCLPAGGETVGGPDSGGGMDDAGEPKGGMEAGPKGEDAGRIVGGDDAGPTSPPPDAGTRMDSGGGSPADADTPMDARID